MHAVPPTPEIVRASAPHTLIAARRTVLAAVTLALAGSIFGFTFGQATGAVTGAEVWLTGSCIVFCAAVLFALLRWPFDIVVWVAPAACLYFLGYLTVGALMSIGRESLLQSFLIYLVWFFPLIAFNRFANVTRTGGVLSLVIYSAAVSLALLRALVFPAEPAEIPLLIVYCLSVTAFTLVLSLFARYREAFIQEQARARGMEATHEAVRASERHFRALFSKAASGIGWLSMDGRCVEVNETFGRMLGRSAGDLQGQSFAELLDASSRDQWQTVLSDLRGAERTDFSGELQMLDATGAVLHIRLSCAVLSRDGADAEAITFVCQDVTEAQQMAARLHQAQRLESIGQLTGGIAHDFNNLLTVILGNADVLQRELAAQPRLAALAQMTGSAAERGATLTSRLLAFARRQALSPQSTDVPRLLTDLQPLLQRSLGEHIELELTADDELWPATLDPVQLESAVLNLCINARDAMPNGGRVLIEMRNVELEATYGGQGDELVPGAYVQIAVTDTGCGMSADQLARAFEPFFTTKEAGKGSGLGLSMVYGFVHQSSGHIRIYSEPGTGTTVKLFLPRASEAADVAQTADADHNTDELADATVLVVEDDELVRKYVTAQLQSLGYTVRVAEHGGAALALLAQGERVDLLFSDVVMPGGMNGIELCQQARAMRPSLPVLLTSGYTEYALAREGQLPAGVSVLSKPYRLKELNRRIAEMVEREVA